MEILKVLIALASAILGVYKTYYAGADVNLLQSLGQVTSLCGMGLSGANLIQALVSKHKQLYAGLSKNQIEECVASLKLTTRHKTILLQLLERVFDNPDLFYLCINDEGSRKNLFSQLPECNEKDIAAISEILPSLLATLYKENSGDLSYNYFTALKATEIKDKNLIKEFSNYILSILCAFTFKREKDNIETNRATVLSIPSLENLKVDFVKDKKIFDTFSAFINHDPIKEIKRKLDKYNDGILKKSKKNKECLFEYEKIIEDNKRYNKLLQELDCAIDKHKVSLPGKKSFENLYSGIKTELSDFHFQNCFFLTGYYGSGKTRLSMELAHEFFKDNVVFKYYDLSNFTNKSVLIDQINELCNRYSILSSNEYQTDKEIKLVIILDNIQELLISKTSSLNDITSVIEEMSDNRLKWLLMIQTDYLREWEKTKSGFRKKYGYCFTGEMEKFVFFEDWLNLNQRYRSLGVVEDIVKKHCSLSSWGWKKRVEDTCFYGPLLALVIVASAKKLSAAGNNKTKKNKSSTALSEDFHYLDFCEKYKYVLTKENKRILLNLLDTYSSNCWGNKSLRIVPAGNQYEDCVSLTQCGLAISDLVNDKVFRGIPDMVWAYVSSEVAKDEVIYAIKNNQVEALCGNEQNYVLQVVLIVFYKEFKKEERVKEIENEIKSNSDTVLLNLFSQYDTGGRNELIKYLTTYYNPAVKREIFEDMLLNCHLGGLPCELLEEVIGNISSSIGEMGINIVANQEFFSLIEGIIRVNSANYTEKQIISLLKKLDTFESSIIKSSYDCKIENDSKLIDYKLLEFFENIGRSLASNVANRIYNAKGDSDNNKAKKINSLLSFSAKAYDEAIGKENNDSNYDRSISPLNGRKAPNSIWDYYIEYLCDEIICREGKEAFKIFENAQCQWYDYSEKPSTERQRRNQLYTLSLGYFSRRNKDLGFFDMPADKQKEYIDEYIERVRMLTTLNDSDFGHKRLALFMMVHTGQKIYNYRSPVKDRLEPFVKELLVDEEMSALKNESTVRNFIKSNYGELK